jgi:hypothetical protein
LNRPMDWVGAAAEAHAGENKNDDGNKNHMFHLSQTGDVLLSPALVPSLPLSSSAYCAQTTRMHRGGLARQSLRRLSRVGPVF